MDSVDFVVANDSIHCELTAQNHGLYSDFKFVTEQAVDYRGPVEREVTYVSATWNFVIMFVVMILVVANKFLSPQRNVSRVASPFQNRTGDRMVRENNSFMNLTSVFVVVSFVLMISLLVQKAILVYGGNHLLHSNFDFFVDVLLSVTTIFILNYLLTTFYGWIFKSENLIVIHVSSHISVMSMCNSLLIPIILLLFFYPYKVFLIMASLIIIAFFFVRLAKLLMETRMLLKLNFVNIFLYLCTIEILPVLVIFKMVINII